MSCRLWSFAAALSAAVVCFPIVVAIGDEPSAASSETPVKTLSAKDVEFALSGKTDLQLVQHPLYQFANECEQRLAIDVEIDTRALADAGIDAERIEINIDLRDITYGAGIYHLLSQHGLAYVVGDGVLVFTTVEKANATHETRVYPAVDLIARVEADGSIRYDERHLKELIQKHIAPGTWESNGGAGTIAVHDGLVTITQNRTAHDQVASLLEIVRKAKQARTEASNDEDTSKVPPRKLTGDQLAETALDKPIDRLQLIMVPIRQIADQLKQQMKVPFLIDDLALSEAGIDVESLEFSFDINATKARFALARMLPRFDLAAVVDREVIVITTRQRAEGMSKLAVYDVGNLLAAEAPAMHAAGGEKLAKLIMSAVDRATWIDTGGPNCVQFAAPWNLLVVSAPAATQQRISDVLAKLREARTKQSESGLAPSETATTDDPVLLRVFKLGSVAGGDQEAADKIAELVRELVPETRSNEPDNPEGPYLRTVGDRMVVMNRRSVLVKVESLLDQFESASGGKHSNATASTGEPDATK